MTASTVTKIHTTFSLRLSRRSRRDVIGSEHLVVRCMTPIEWQLPGHSQLIEKVGATEGDSDRQRGSAHSWGAGRLRPGRESMLVYVELQNLSVES
jgi:hypothetical protein